MLLNSIAKSRYKTSLTSWQLCLHYCSKCNTVNVIRYMYSGLYLQVIIGHCLDYVYTATTYRFYMQYTHATPVFPMHNLSIN